MFLFLNVSLRIFCVQVRLHFFFVSVFASRNVGGNGSDYGGCDCCLL